MSVNNSTPEQKIIGTLSRQAVERDDVNQLRIITNGLKEYVDGVNRAVKGLKFLDTAGCSSFDDNMLLDEHVLDVFVPARFDVVTDTGAKLEVPPTIWMVTQNVTRKFDQNTNTFKIENTGLQATASFDRGHEATSDGQDAIVLAQTDTIFEQPFKVLEIETTAFALVYLMSATRAGFFRPSVTMTGSYPINQAQ